MLGSVLEPVSVVAAGLVLAPVLDWLTVRLVLPWRVSCYVSCDASYDVSCGVSYGASFCRHDDLFCGVSYGDWCSSDVSCDASFCGGVSFRVRPVAHWAVH